MRKSRLFCLLAALLIGAMSLAGCGEGIKKEDYPDSLFVTGYDLTVSGAALSKGENPFVMSLTDALYVKTLKTEEKQAEEEKVGHFSLVDAASFPEKDEDATLKAGGVYRKDLESILPPDREVVVVSAKGSLVSALAENTVYAFLNQDKDTKPERVFHFTGIAFVYDAKRPKDDMIIDTAILNTNGKIEASKTYTIAMNRPLAERLAEQYPQAGIEIVESVGKELDIFCDYMKDNDLSNYNTRFVSKGQRDTPTVVITVLMIIGVLAIAGVVTAYFVMKKKQKAARKQRGNQPRIDV